MVFKRKPKPPLDDAIRMAHDAIAIVFRYKRDKAHRLSAEERQQLDQLVKILHESHAAAQYIARCLQQRANDEPEGARKFTTGKTWDY
jgi:hypothetical protein